MLATYIGISHHKIIKGVKYVVEVNGTRVSVSGTGFNYTFTYDSEEEMQKDWLFE